MPALHTSVWVQLSPSSQALLSGWAGFEHAPVVVSQTPAAWQRSLAEHVTGFSPVQTPTWHESAWVHALLSLQAVPSASAGLLHMPVAMLHEPAE